jgi:hypothetical protein
VLDVPVWNIDFYPLLCPPADDVSVEVKYQLLLGPSVIDKARRSLAGADRANAPLYAYWV